MRIKFLGLLASVLFLGLTACKDKEKEEPKCAKEGTIADFKIKCNKAIVTYDIDGVKGTPSNTPATVDKFNIEFADENKELKGKDAGSGKTGINVTLVFKKDKTVKVDIP